MSEPAHSLLNRRQFLQSGSLAACALWPITRACGEDDAAAKQSPVLSRVIDTHTHFYDPTRPQGVPWPSPQEALLYRKVMPAEFVEVAAPEAMTGTIVVEASPWLEDNQWLLDLAESNPVIQGIIGNLDFQDANFQMHLDRFAKNSLFKGVRISTPLERLGDEKTVYTHLRKFAETGLTLDINGPAAGMSAILNLKKRIPELRIVIEHLPKSPSSDQQQRQIDEDALRELATLPQVFAKVSYVLKYGLPAEQFQLARHLSELDEIWSLFGADKVLYGSDWPVSSRVCPYGKIIGLMREYVSRRTLEDAGKFFWKNAEAAYQLA